MYIITGFLILLYICTKNIITNKGSRVTKPIIYYVYQTHVYMFIDIARGCHYSLDWTTRLKFFPFLDKIMWFFKYLTPGDLNHYVLETTEFL